MKADSSIQEINESEEEPLGLPPAWTESYPAPEGLYVPFRRFANWISAEIARIALEAEGVPCWILPLDRTATLFGFSFTLFVEARRLHRARFVYEEDGVTDSELLYLATGELSPAE